MAGGEGERENSWGERVSVALWRVTRLGMCVCLPVTSVLCLYCFCVDPVMCVY